MEATPDSSVKRERSDDVGNNNQIDTPLAKRARIFDEMKNAPKLTQIRVLKGIDDLDQFELQECYRIAEAAVKAQSTRFEATSQVLERFLTDVFTNWEPENDPGDLQPLQVVPCGLQDLTVLCAVSPVCFSASFNQYKAVLGINPLQLTFSRPGVFTPRPLGNPEKCLRIERSAKQVHPGMINGILDLASSVIHNYNQSRAILYARRLLHFRSQRESHVVSWGYQFARVEILLLDIPTLQQSIPDREFIRIMDKQKALGSVSPGIEIRTGTLIGPVENSANGKEGAANVDQK